MHALHKIPTMQVLVVGDEVEWTAPWGVATGTVDALGDTWTLVNGYWFCGDARKQLRDAAEKERASK